MSFDKLWESFAEKKGLTPEKKLTITGEQLEKLCKQFFEQGIQNQKQTTYIPSDKEFASMFGNMFGGNQFGGRKR